MNEENIELHENYQENILSSEYNICSSLEQALGRNMFHM